MKAVATGATSRPPGRPYSALVWLAIAVLTGSWLAVPATGHPLAPSLLELREAGDYRVEVTWKISSLNPQAASLDPVLPATCRPSHAGSIPVEPRDGALIARWTVDCEAGLPGTQIGVDGLGRTDTRVLVRVVLGDGRTLRAILDAEAPRWVVPERTTATKVAGSYLRLGFEHILGGYDHLLFVLGLLFLIRGRRILFGTITAFTVGHSVTLSMAVLGLVRVPSALVELGIAISIWILAVQLAAGGREHRVRRPWRMAGFFGLLHGLGFAGALAEAGLPADEIPLALVSFNVGIELGQLVFIAAVLGLVAAVSWRAGGARPLEQRLALPAAYLIGTIAFKTCLERGVELWRIIGEG